MVGLEALVWAVGMMGAGLAMSVVAALVGVLVRAPDRPWGEALRAGLFAGGPSLATGALLFVLTLFDVLRGSTAYALVRPAAPLCVLIGLVLATREVIALRRPAE